MSSVTCGAVFDALVDGAKARVVRLVDEGGLPRDDGEFLLRALIDLESDGILLWGRERAADAEFYAAVTEYLVARAGRVAAEVPLLGGAERLPPPRELDRAVLQLISH